MKPTEPDDTQTEILDAAEQLFATHGFDGTSIRAVTRRAGVNVAAVHYHFGSKEALLRGVTDRVAGPISARRAALLRAAIDKAAPARPDVESLLDSFLRADIEILLELQEHGPRVAHFLGRTYSDQTDWIQQMAREQYSASREFFPLLSEALPHLDHADLALRMTHVVAVIVHLFATWPEDGTSESDALVVLRQLVAFLSAGLRAPLPDPAPNRG